METALYYHRVTLIASDYTFEVTEKWGSPVFVQVHILVQMQS